MPDAALREEIRAIIATTLNVDGELPPSASPETVGEWTSLAHMTLLVVLEERFGVTFDMDRLLDMTDEDRIVASLSSLGVAA